MWNVQQYFLHLTHARACTCTLGLKLHFLHFGSTHVILHKNIPRHLRSLCICHIFRITSIQALLNIKQCFAVCLLCVTIRSLLRLNWIFDLKNLLHSKQHLHLNISLGPVLSIRDDESSSSLNLAHRYQLLVSKEINHFKHFYTHKLILINWNECKEWLYWTCKHGIISIYN